MKSKEELLALSLELILSNRNKEVIDLLNDETLKQYREPVLYLRRGLAFKRIEEYKKAISDYDKALELNPAYSDALHNRGLARDLTGDYDNAISDFDKAIQINPHDAQYYNGRGTVYNSKYDYDKAIPDYLKAIELDPKYEDAYNNIGITYDSKGDYLKAIECYNKAIELNPDYQLPYLNRGSSYEHMGKSELALKDYLKAIELKPDFSHAYSSIASLYSKEGRYDEALKYAELASKYSPYSKYFRKLLDEARARVGEEVSSLKDGSGFSARYVENAIKEINEEDKKPIRIACAAINEKVEQIRKRMLYKGKDNVVHYTQLRTADILIMNDQSRLRYSNVVFMNDPEEGKVLVNFLLDQPLKEAYEKGKLQEDNNIYLGSFLPEDRADYLVMWRTYGKGENNEEATGCSITLDRRFFDIEDKGLYVDMRPDSQDPTERQALYQVLYYDKKRNSLVSDEDKDMVDDVNVGLSMLTDELGRLLMLKDKQDENDLGTKNKAINKFVYRYVTELSYFFKSSDYQFEREMRVIKYYLPGADAVRTDLNSPALPRRLYIESTNTVRPNILKVILGPKVSHPERWVYLDSVMKQNGFKMELESSKVKFQ